jgi:glyoxylase-like metal-dependent hydrolase (beta-lactamase superfamily II)
MPSIIPFVYHFDYEYGAIKPLSPKIRRITANNPNHFTFRGTNTYIIGKGEVALIDPGPDIDEHITAIINGLKDEVITHIFITHSHFDHWPGCKPIKDKTGAKTFGYFQKNNDAAIRSNPDNLVSGLNQEERYADTDFVPDISVNHGDIIEGNGWTVECVHTPGHAFNHMCYQLKEEKALFSGDHVMGWSTSVISPPSGDMEAYMNSLEILLDRDDQVLWPAHGPGVNDPKPFIQSFIDHRKNREQQIIDCLKKGINKIKDMVPDMYYDIHKALYPAAERSVLASLIYMEKRGTVICQGQASIDSEYHLP